MFGHHLRLACLKGLFSCLKFFFNSFGLKVGLAEGVVTASHFKIMAQHGKV